MGKYLLRRLVISLPILFGISIFTFLMVNLAPGDPVAALINPETAAELGPEWYELQRERLGLDAPLPVRYVRWLGQLVQGNFGYSTFDRLPVIDKIAARVWPTLYLMLTVQLISLGIAIPVGIISALKQYSFVDYLVTVLGFAAISIPSFFLALGGIYLRVTARLVTGRKHAHARTRTVDS